MLLYLMLQFISLFQTFSISVTTTETVEATKPEMTVAGTMRKFM